MSENETTKRDLSKELQKLINYQFHDQSRLEEACTRVSFRNERQLPLRESMDPLATLGDAVLDLAVIYHLYEQGERAKGRLTEIKIKKVKRTNTRSFAERHNLKEYINWGKGENQDKVYKKGNKALDTCVEALIGAVYFDAQKSEKNGMKVVIEMLEHLDFFDQIMKP